MANPTVLTYDPRQVQLIVGGQIGSGFADDSMIEVERDEDAYVKKVGADGSVTRGRIADRTGKIRVYLMQSSSFNSVLSGFAIADETSNTGAVPCLGRDGSGSATSPTVFATDFGWVKKFPKLVLKKGVEVWMWEIDTGNLEIFAGNN